MMKLVLGADHGGFELKENIKEYLKEEGIEFTDYGTLSGTASGQLFATIPFRQNSAAAITTPTF